MDSKNVSSMTSDSPGSPWYQDPTGTATKVVAFLGAVTTVVSAAIGVYQGKNDINELWIALAPVIVTLVSLYALHKARGNAFKPSTVTTVQAKALDNPTQMGNDPFRNV